MTNTASEPSRYVCVNCLKYNPPDTFDNRKVRMPAHFYGIRCGDLRYDQQGVQQSNRRPFV
jgi:hypothetical protein